MFGRCSFVMLYVFLALALLSGCALTYAASGFASLAAVWQVPVVVLGSFLALVVLFLLVVLVSCLFVDPKKLLEKPSGYFRFLLNEFCRIALALGGVHVNVTGLEKVPRKGRFLLVSNHRFAFDPIVFYAVMPWAELAFLSKKENFSIFIVAQVMREVLCLPVDRNNDRESLKSILKAIQFIKDDKASIAVFPEGGTNKTDAPLLPYRSGVFKIAQKSNVPIVVCSLVNSRAILHNMFRKHTEVWLDVLDVVPAEELAGKTAIEVSERVHAVMEAGIVVSCQTQRDQFQNRETCMRMLRSKLIEIKEREHLDKISDIKGAQLKIEWGSQIRNYVFMPYTLVKDTRTGFETSNVNAVMDGALDGFINAYLTCLATNTWVTKS